MIRSLILLLLATAAVALGQTGTTQPTQSTNAFGKSTLTLNIVPVSASGGSTALTGVETDMLVAALHPISIGETSIVSNKMSFIGGRLDWSVKPISTWVQNHSSVNGYKFQIGPTFSFGAIKASGLTHYGGRAGIFVNYSLGWAVGMQFEAQWNRFPGYASNATSFSLGPNCHW